MTIIITMIAMLRYEPSWNHAAGRAMKKGKRREKKDEVVGTADMICASVYHGCRVPVFCGRRF